MSHILGVVKPHEGKGRPPVLLDNQLLVTLKYLGTQETHLTPAEKAVLFLFGGGNLRLSALFLYTKGSRLYAMYPIPYTYGCVTCALHTLLPHAY